MEPNINQTVIIIKYIMVGPQPIHLNYYHFHFKRFNDISLNYLYHKKTDHDKNINDDPKNEESSGISFFNNTKKNKSKRIFTKEKSIL